MITKDHAWHELRCPGCHKEDFNYDPDTDQLHCALCQLTLSSELANAIEKGALIWVAQDKRCFKIEDMETSHIQHCISMIFHKGNGWRGRFMEPLIEELKKRSAEEIPY